MSEKDSSKRIRLMVEGGPTREFPGDRTFVIGRSQNVDFSIPHPNLSREHVRISLKNGDVWMEDLGSANGTFVQGQRVPAKSQVKIKPHYRILLGTGSNVMLSIQAVDASEAPVGSVVTEAPAPKGDVDLGSHEPTVGAGIPKNEAAESTASSFRDQVREQVREHTKTMGTGLRANKAGNGKLELDFPQQHFPQEAKKEKLAELRIIEAKKQRVVEDIQYKEREVEDLRSKIRQLREESLKLKEQTEGFKREIQPLAEKRADLEARVTELDIIYEEKIDALETGFQDLKSTLEESHAVRMARADKDHKEKTRRIDEEYARKLQELETGTQAIRAEGDRLREQVTKEKFELEEALKKIRADAESLEAERRLTQVRVDTEIAQLQGTKLKLENELETIRREKDRVGMETQNSAERGRTERAKLEESRKSVEAAVAERDSVLRAIEQTKQSEEKNLQRIEELRSQIAGFEARAQSIQSMLAQAEKDAETTRKQAKDEAESHRKAVSEQIEAERLAIKKNAEAQASAHIQAAESQAQARIQTLEVQLTTRSQTLEAQMTARLQAAEAQANQKVQTADAQASQKVHAAETQAKGMIEKAQAEVAGAAARMKEDAEKYYADKKQSGDHYLAEKKQGGDHYLVEKKQGGDQYFAEKKKNADDYFTDVQNRASSIEHTIRATTEKATMDMNSQLDQKRKAIETELIELRRRADQEVRQVRANALSEIDAAKEREAKDFLSRVNRRSKEIGDQIDRVVGAKLSTQFGVNMDPVSLKAFSDEVHAIVANVLSPGKGSSASKEATFSTILPSNTQARDDAAMYWKKMGVAAAVVFALILGKVFAPGFYASIGNGVGKAFEVKDNTDEVVRRMLRERQLSMTFVTEQDQQFRDSYTDNILYTEGFIEMKEDIESQKAWTLELNRFFQGELGLTEKAIVQFGSAEGRMVRELVETRKSIIPQNSAAGMQKMREQETGYVKEMKFIVRTDGAWQKFLVYHREYYRKYTASFVNRAPASTQ